MTDYKVTVYDRATVPETSVNEMFFTFSKDDLEPMLSFISMVMEHSMDPMNILIES